MSVTVIAKFLRGSPKAIMIDVDGQEMWLPRSQLANVPESIAQGQEIEIMLTDWIAEQKGLTLGEERYVAESYHEARPLGGTGAFAGAEAVEIHLVKDMKATPIKIMCRCDNGRDANMIAAALCLTEGKV